MKTAIISDVHANLEAFQAVLKDIENKGIKEIFCLGDVIGYGPNPRECLKLAKDFPISLRGNHEEAVIFISIDFREDAANAIEWTRDTINSNAYNKDETNDLWDWLGELPRIDERDDMLFVHGTPREPTREYLRPIDVTDKEKTNENFDLIRHICFCGHTHEPGVFEEGPDGKKIYYPIRPGKNMYRITEKKCIINVGSVGQPRDGDNRACYVVLENDIVTYHRIPYDHKITMNKILEIEILPKILATRLEAGR
ncbi:MAG: metallophosphoesterase family protein [Planctomycetes bacterium]|nr:metallophosphoesterase family protein [Planctomycetota bacterium]